MTLWEEASGYIIPPFCHVKPQDNMTTRPCNPMGKSRPRQATSHDHATPRANAPRASHHTQPRNTKTTRPTTRSCNPNGRSPPRPATISPRPATIPPSPATIDNVTAEKAEPTASIREIQYRKTTD